MTQTLKWEGIENPTTESCTIETTPSGLSVSGDITGSINTVHISIDYQVQLGSDWRVRSFAAKNRITGFAFHAQQSAPGKWFDQDNHPLPDYDGCMDIDLFPTPFTNSLPLKRNAFQAGESMTFHMLWIDLVDGIIRVDRQQYTCLASGIYGFDSLDTGFSTRIIFTDELYVQYYPGLFRLAG